MELLLFTYVSFVGNFHLPASRYSKRFSPYNINITFHLYFFFQCDELSSTHGTTIPVEFEVFFCLLCLYFFRICQLSYHSVFVLITPSSSSQEIQVKRHGIVPWNCQIQVNGLNLAEVQGGETAITNWFSCNGPDFVFQIRIQVKKEDGSAEKAGF